MTRLLYICSDSEIGAAFSSQMKQYNIEVSSVADSHRAYDWLLDNPCDLIIVDPDVPDQDSTPSLSSHDRFSSGLWKGTGAVRELRAFNINLPVLLYTTKQGETYETASLDAGADDVLFKSSSYPLLISRIHAHLRRTAWNLHLQEDRRTRILVGRFVMDTRAKLLITDQQVVRLNTREISLLRLLAEPTMPFIPVKGVLDGVWGDSPRRSIKAFTNLRAKLRRKFERAGLPDPIENHRGLGFRLSPLFLNST